MRLVIMCTTWISLFRFRCCLTGVIVRAMATDLVEESLVIDDRV